MKKQIFSLLLAVLMLLSFAGCNGNKENNVQKLSKDAVYSTDAVAGTLKPTIKSGEKLLCQNDWLSLIYNTKTYVVTVFDRITGKYYASSSQSAVPGANAKDLAQFSLTYSDIQGKGATFDSYTESVLHNQVEVKTEGEKATFLFTVGDASRGLEVTPSKISDERFQKLLLDKISTFEQSTLKHCYSFMEDFGFWQRRNIPNPNQAARLVEIIDKAGYTEDDLMVDNAENGVDASGDVKKVFQIPLCYTLDKDTLTVAIDMDKVTYPKDYPITKISLLEYFGAVNTDSDGYMFVPDGSGAIIPFDTVSNETAGYVGSVYGKDVAMRQSAETSRLQEIKLPVYGMTYKTHGFISVIEEADALCSIYSYNKGSKHNYNVVYSELDFLKTESMSLGENEASDNYTFFNFQNSTYTGNYKLRFIFSDKGDYDYSDMAVAYRNYLEKTGRFNDAKVSADAPFVLETVCGFEKTKEFLGFSYEGMETLSKFEESGIMAKTLQESGVKNLNLSLLGWYGDGIEYSFADNIKPLNIAGGKKDLTALLKTAEENGFDVFPEVELLKFSNACGNSVKNKYSASTLDSKALSLRIYNLASLKKNYQIEKNEYYILKLSSLEKLTNSLKKTLDKYSIKNLNVGSMANMLYSDFTEDMSYDRQSAMNYIDEVVTDLGKNGKLMLNNPYLTEALNADIITDAPLWSSQYRISNDTVPFYQIVFHGNIDYTGSAINYAGDNHKEFLRSVEYGAGLKYILTYSDTSITRNSDYNELYSSDFDDYTEEIREYYAAINAIHAKIGKSKIVSHTKLKEQVYCTEYENGVKIYVNYSEKNVKEDGVKIAALDYKVIGGDR